ncbi:MAG TPA: PH domain-containing protein [Candidatus Woesebacteria bacterium]|nr:PH domain-containing protein [Candidatus Woesebacteria bacterium]
MNRSKDLDTVAPDDEVVVPTPKKKEVVAEKKIEVDNSKPDFSQTVYDILGHTKSPFSSFLVRPKILTFTERDENEEIYLAVRPHWANNISWVIIAFLMLFVPLFFKYFTFINFFPSQYRFTAVLFWYLITFIYAFEKFLSWYFNLFLITNERVVDIDFNNLLNKHFAEADLSMIQDVSSSVKGIFGTFFNFGDVLIQTASEVNQINFEKVPNPEKIIKLLKELRDLEDQKNGGGKDNE